MDAKGFNSRTNTEQELRAELLRVLHSSSAPIQARAAALNGLRQMGVDLVSELKALDPDVAADIAAEAVLLQDESGSLLDALEQANLGDDER